ncbi:hypothetical protein P5G62_009740 [Neobacillus sp. 179-C4.2 HS]|uniref:DUF3169 family protein n=1 Tax=Neobacillus driksii TaxID=3035913 RepID=A0ABV4YRA4_9BACI|nr:hypothetical protein [Neobacillus sp. 179.-C4.2 HS]MDP5194963.1 hypothetical protein [Neobacillus sp. 179.-C4.2 HS]
MLQRFLRSPIGPMLIFVSMIGFFIISLLSNESSKLPVRYSFLLFVAFAFIWLVLIQLHNRKNLKQQIKALGVIPPEFREMDEGQQWLTFKACRNVYIYYSFALPVIAGICFALGNYKLVPLLSIGILGLGQYIVYWLTIRELNRY